MLRWISGLALLLLLRADVSFGQAGGASHPNFEAASIRSYDPASPANFFTMVGGPVYEESKSLHVQEVHLGKFADDRIRYQRLSAFDCSAN